MRHEHPGHPDDRNAPAAPARGGGVAAPRADRVWRENRRWVAAVLLAYKPREAELDDLLQVVAAAVVRAIDEVRDADAVKPWLRTIAINAARAAGRKASVRRRVLRGIREQGEAGAAGYGGVLASGDEPSPDERELDEEASAVLRAARELPEGYREPLLLRCARGMTYRQIAAVTGLPESTIETRIARGRRMLRQMLAANEAAASAPQTPVQSPVQTSGSAGAPTPGGASMTAQSPAATKESGVTT